jgi:hypothetical protein
MSSDYEKISLPLRQEDGSVVCHTFKGEWLVGFGKIDENSGRPWMGISARLKERERWGDGDWYVIRSASGKLVVYQEPDESDGAPSVAIYGSFEMMEPHVPPNIYEEALLKAGLKEPPQLREVPLEGV